MDFEQAVQFHEETKAYGSILGLDSIRSLMGELGDIWKELKIVHVAGTNGKGSVCCFLASALREAGYRVGQYSSPVVFDLREAYQMDGVSISEESYASCMQKIANACGRMKARGRRHPTVFEVETALAFLWFYENKCDVALLETGMGGSMDATNLIEKPLCSVITSISMDHMAFLGNSLVEIAAAKAGIIKEGCPVVTAAQLPEAERILRESAAMRHAPYYPAKQMTQICMKQGRLTCEHPVYGRLVFSMAGSYQADNAAVALEVLRVLHKRGFSISEEQVKAGIASAVWAGRFECICRDPLFYIDGAHNPDAAGRLAESLHMHFPGFRRIGIMGVMADKPYEEMITILLPHFARIYTVTPDQARSLPAEVLAEEITRRGGRAAAANSVAKAVRQAYETALAWGGGAMITAFGSLFYLKEVKDALYEITGEK